MELFCLFNECTRGPRLHEMQTVQTGRTLEQRVSHHEVGLNRGGLESGTERVRFWEAILWLQQREVKIFLLTHTRTTHTQTHTLIFFLLPPMKKLLANLFVCLMKL